MTIFITVGTFLGMFVVLIGLIPTQFFAVQPGANRAIEVPESFEAVDIQYFAETYNDTVPDNSAVSYDLGGKHFRMEDRTMTQHLLYHIRYDKWWIINWGFHDMIWRNSDGIKIGSYIEPHHIDDYYNPDDDASKFLVSDDKVEVVIYLGYNRTAYDNATQAWINDDLDFLTCMGFDQLNTGMNAWSLIGMLLFFQLPQVHPLVNAIIAIPLWMIIAYLSFSLILKVIKALPFT